MPREKIKRCGGEALHSFEHLLERKPDIDHAMLANAVSKVVVLRDALVEDRRAGNFTKRDEQRLMKVNSVLSFAFSAEFPLVGIQWERIEKTAEALRSLVDSGGTDASVEPSTQQ